MGFGTQNYNEKPLTIGFTFYNEAGELVDTLLDLHEFVREHPDILMSYPDIHDPTDRAYNFIEANQQDSEEVKQIAQGIRDLINNYLALKPATPPTSQDGNEHNTTIEEIDTSSSPSQPPGMLVYSK